MIALGVLVLTIAIAAGVGGGVASATAKSKGSTIVNLVSESTGSKPQDSSAPTDSS